MLHGKIASKKAEESAKNIFQKGSIGTDLRTIFIDQSKIKNGMNIIDLVLRSKLINSKSEIRRTIKNKGIKINNLTVEDEKLVGDDLPTVKIDKEEIKKGINIVDLVISSNLLTSKSEVRRAINNRGIKVNNETIENDKENISINNFNNENYLKLSHGKKNHIIIKMA